MSCGFFEIMSERYDTSAAAHKIAELMAEKRAIAFYGGKYHGQFHFTGRLTQPITALPDFKDLLSFATKYQSCYIIVSYENSENISASIINYHYPAKSKTLGLLACKTLLENPGLNSIVIPS
jgi:hypothetical protein